MRQSCVWTLNQICCSESAKVFVRDGVGKSWALCDRHFGFGLDLSKTAREPLLSGETIITEDEYLASLVVES